jgi:hypothetical protein
MTNLKSLFQRHFSGKDSQRAKTALTDESGQSALVIIMLVIVAAGVAISQLSLDNSRETLEEEQIVRAKFARIQAAIDLYAIQDLGTRSGDYVLPCPAPTTGVMRTHNGTGCNTASGDNRGIVPYSTLGLARSDVIDPRGNYITYIVNAPNVSVCNGTSAATDSVTDSNGSNVGYALISHGRNGFGEFNRNSGNQINAGNASTNERDNCPTATGTCTPSATNGYRSGPVSSTQGSGFFDDITRGVNFSDRFSTECAELNKSTTEENLTFTEDGFTDSTGDGDSDDITVTPSGGGSAAEGSGVLTVTENVEITSTESNFTGTVTPIYTRIHWRPTAATTTTGFSIITRANSSTRSAGTSNYTDGITVDFFSDGDPANNQTIRIQENGSVGATSSGTYDLNLGTTYELEVFDDGTQVWGRITEIGNTSNQATVVDGTSNDTATPNQIIYLHDDTSGASSTLDNLLIAKGVIAAELDNSGTLSNSSSPDISSKFANETNFSEEGWLFLRDSSSGTVDMMLVDDSGPTDSVFRVNAGSGQLSYADNEPSSISVSRTFSTGSWVHVAFTCDSAGTSRDLMINGSSVTSDTNTCDIKNNAADAQNRIVNSSGGRILLSEIRQWSNRQNVASTTSNYVRRVDGSTANLVLQLRMDDGQGGGAGTFPSDTTANDTDSGTANNFTISNGRLVGFKSPFITTASDVYPGNEDGTDFFKCVYDGGTGGTGAAGTATTATITLPLDIPEVLIKVWGAGGSAGGGASGAVGGGGGYATGRLTSVSSSNLAGNQLHITAGGGGGISGGNGGGGGGGGSAVRFDNGTTETVLLIAGGGGGGGGNSTGATAGGAGGGSAGVAATSTCGGQGGNGATGGAGATCNTSNAGGSNIATPTAGRDGGAAANGGGGPGGIGFGNGGDGELSGSNTGAGGGGGYAGGGSGARSGSARGGGGGASGYVLSGETGFTSASQSAGSGTAPGNSGDSDRGTLGVGGTAAAGTGGRVVICWSTSCLP